MDQAYRSLGRREAAASTPWVQVASLSLGLEERMHQEGHTLVQEGTLGRSSDEGACKGHILKVSVKRLEQGQIHELNHNLPMSCGGGCTKP